MKSREYRRKGILKLLGLDPDSDLWEAGWDLSGQSYSIEDMAYLTPEFIRRQCEVLEIDAGKTGAIVAGLSLFDSYPALRRLFWHCRFVLFCSSIPSEEARRWPDLAVCLGEPASLFYVWILLSNVPAVIAQNRRRRIPEKISIETLRSLNHNLDQYKAVIGTYGIFSPPSWLIGHFQGRHFRLGRLEYEIGSYDYRYPVHRKRRSREAIALAGPKYDASEGDSWRSALQETGSRIKGNPVHPEGRVLQTTINLRKMDWERALRRGTPVIAVHIPDDGPLRVDECRESLFTARQFFRDHFPEHKAAAFICTSWLLDNQLTGLLSRDSNIVKFLTSWYLLPLDYCTDVSVRRRVFGVGPEAALDTLPRDTSLQRGVINHFASGGHFYGTGGFIFMDDIAHWGEAYYRRSFDI